MSIPREAEDVKLIVSLFSPEAALIGEVIHGLEKRFGPTDWKSPELIFERTRYYAKEMGWPLNRRFISFATLISPMDIVEIKLFTNDLENRYLQAVNRRINIDPGYISLERLILATGKNFIHRIYLGRGIYADLTLIFQGGTFRPLEWTYRDYAEAETIGYFNLLREGYKNLIRGQT